MSLINADLKITCKIGAERLECHIIHSDQTGFINLQHPVNNTWSLIGYSVPNNPETTIISLAAEKEFESKVENLSSLFFINVDVLTPL